MGMLKSTAKAHFGTLQAIADAIGISKSAVGQWPERIPQGPAYKLQFVTGGKLRVDPSMYPKITKKKGLKGSSKHSSARDMATA